MSPFPKYFSKTDKPVMQLRTSIRLRFLVADFGLTPVKRATETISFTTKGIISGAAYIIIFWAPYINN